MAAVPSPDPAPPVRTGLPVALAQNAIRALWLYVVPALLAAALLRFLVPSAGAGFPGLVARVARAYPVPLLALAFLAFSALAHYWRFHLPGGRHASRLPPEIAPGERDPDRLRAWAELAESLATLSSASTSTRLSTAVDAATFATFGAHVSEAQSAMRAGEFERAQRAARSAATIAAPVLSQRSRRQAIGAALALAGAAGVAFALRALIVESYEVENRSMLPTLQPHDRIAASKLAYGWSHEGPAVRGDVIVFSSTRVPGIGGPVPPMLVKRVIGIPGDRIAVQGGVPIINGWPVPSCDAGQYLYVVPDSEGTTVGGRVRVEFLGDRTYLTVHAGPAPELPEPYVVGPGEVFVLGDNRSNSVDSRVWNGGRGGGVPVEAIQGPARWFLVGTHASGEADFGRFLRPLDALQGHLHVEGINGAAIEDGIARCLQLRPAQVLPPPPGGAPQPSAEREPGP